MTSIHFDIILFVCQYITSIQRDKNGECMTMKNPLKRIIMNANSKQRNPSFSNNFNSLSNLCV